MSNPLHNKIIGAGYISVFDKISIIGDSLASGELDDVGGKYEKISGEHYNLCWPEYIRKITGNEVYNFSRGGMTAFEFLTTFAFEKDFFNEKYKSKAYIIALGVNDLLVKRQNFGEYDVAEKYYEKDTFVFWYYSLIEKIKQIQPDAKIFLVTMPKACGFTDTKELEQLKKGHRRFILSLCSGIENLYAIDLNKYSPKYNLKFKEKYYLKSHLNPCGYYFTAQQILKYIDYIIKNNFEDFKYVGFIGEENV